MKYLFRTLFFLSIIFPVACNPPASKPEQAPKKSWFKGNLHTHSYWSDGDEFPEVIMDWYKTRDYQFIALSDHNILAEGEKWIDIREDSIYQQAFNSYLKNYGEEWVTYKMNDGKIQVKLKTLEEYRGRYEEVGEFLIIQSEEITDRFEDKEIHMNATNIQHKITPKGGNSVVEVLQNNINQVLKQRKETGVPIIPHINHPNFHYSITLEDMIAIEGERFFEVYNGHPMVHNLGDSQHISTEEMWDLINLSYLQQNKPLMYGLATDDSHHYHVMDSSLSNAGRGWIVVQADSLSPASVIAAMETGSFYASSGVSLSDISFDQNKLSLEIKAEKGIEYQISFIGVKKGASIPEEFASIKGNKASFDVTDDVLFVRSKITSSKPQENPVEGMVYEMAWTQPVLGKK